MTPAKASAARRVARAARGPAGKSRAHERGSLTDRIVGSIRAEIPAFAEVEPDEVRRAVESDLPCGRAAVEERRAPTPEELDVSAAVAVSLGRAGVPLDAINQARRILLRRIFDAWRESAQARGVDATTQLEHLYSLWHWADSMTARASAVYPHPDADDGADDQQRAAFVREVLEGALPAAEAQSRAAAYGLLPGGRYVTIRGRPGPGVDTRQLLRALELSARGAGARMLVAAVDGEVWGLASRTPAIRPEDGVVGLGPAADLGAAAASFAFAARALSTAAAFGREGVVSIDELSLRPVILAEDELGERLVRRYLEPLRELGDFGATLEHSVRQYLECDMRIDEGARALIIHPNTLRHRIDRFQQLTGADLRRTEDVVEVWWALQRRRVAAPPEPPST